MPGRIGAKTLLRSPGGGVEAAETQGIVGGAGLGLTGPESSAFQHLRAAIVGQVLPPGTKLAEEELASIYSMSRMHIRRVLLGLSHARVVTLFPGRGAFVAKPTPSEALAVFQARRLIETATLAEMQVPASPALVAALKRNVAAEQAANRRGDRAEAIRLSGAFHGKIISSLANVVVARISEELVARSSLVLSMYHRSGTPICRDDDHANLAKVLGSGDFRKAALLMRHHLTDMESSLDVSERTDKPVELRKLLHRTGSAPAGAPRKTAPRKTAARAVAIAGRRAPAKGRGGWDEPTGH